MSRLFFRGKGRPRRNKNKRDHGHEVAVGTHGWFAIHVDNFESGVERHRDRDIVDSRIVRTKRPIGAGAPDDSDEA